MRERKERRMEGGESGRKRRMGEGMERGEISWRRGEEERVKH